MKDVAIRTCTASDIPDAARFISIVNTGDAVAIPDLPESRSEAEQLLSRIVAAGLPAYILRLYEGDGRICGFFAVHPYDTTKLLGPLLHIGDWAGHADAMLKKLLTEAASWNDTSLLDAGELNVRFHAQNRNMLAFVSRHGGTVEGGHTTSSSTRTPDQTDDLSAVVQGRLPTTQR